MSTTTRTNHQALFAILSSLADNKQAIGRRYAYWCNGAPALEAAVAAAAMTQDELGHARTLYPLLADFTQAEADPSQVEPETRTLHYHLAFLDSDFQGWSDFVATNFLLDSASQPSSRRRRTPATSRCASGHGRSSRRSAPTEYTAKAGYVASPKPGSRSRCAHTLT